MSFKMTGSFRVSVDPSARPTDSLMDLIPEERARYLSWYQRFKLLNILSWLGFGVFLFSGWLGSSIHRADWEALFFLGAGLWLAAGVWKWMLDCPRCGIRFSGGLLRAANPLDREVVFPLKGMFPRKCYGCDLSLRELSALSKRRTNL